MIKAYVFDLDDTLYPEYSYVKSGFGQVALYIEDKYRLKNVYQKLIHLFEENKQNVYNRLLDKENISYTPEDIREIVEIYRQHIPQNIKLFYGVRKTLEDLKKQGYKLGIITDGRVTAQQAKIKALGVDKLVDNIIITDSLGGEQFRKPNPLAFEKMANMLGVKFEEMAYIGDNPSKDFAISQKYPITTVQVIGGGIYKTNDYKDGIQPDIKIKSIREIRRFVK